MTAHTWQSSGRTVDREYVYAADPGAYVDEVVTQIEPGGGNIFTLCDANYNVVASADGRGHSTSTPAFGRGGLGFWRSARR